MLRDITTPRAKTDKEKKTKPAEKTKNIATDRVGKRENHRRSGKDDSRPSSPPTATPSQPSSRTEISLISYYYQCPNCLTFHKGITNSSDLNDINTRDSGELIGMECLEPMDYRVTPSDDYFIKWLAMKQHGQTMYCNYVTFVHGRPVRSKSSNTQQEQEGKHVLYDGKYDEETERFLEERVRRN